MLGTGHVSALEQTICGLAANDIIVSTASSATAMKNAAQTQSASSQAASSQPLKCSPTSPPWPNASQPQ